MVDYPGAIDMLVDRGRVFPDRNPKDVIVVHKTAGFSTIEQLGEYFATNSEEVTSHFGVGLDGRVAQFVRLSDGAAANCCVDHVYSNYDQAFWNPYVNKYGNLNLCTLSVEHIDPETDNSTTPPQAQREASFKLIKWLMDRYSIPFSRVKGHNTIDGTSRARCPGNYPWSDLQAFVEGDVAKTISIGDVADHFTVTSDGMWVCKKNGFVIGHAMLSRYRTYGNEALCGLTFLGLPLSNEIGFGSGRTWQKFERGILVYDPNHTYDRPAGDDGSYPVYVAHLDTGFGLNAYGVPASGVDPRIQQYLVTADESIQSAKALLPK